MPQCQTQSCTTSCENVSQCKCGKTFAYSTVKAGIWTRLSNHQRQLSHCHSTLARQYNTMYAVRTKRIEEHLCNSASDFQVSVRLSVLVLSVLVLRWETAVLRVQLHHSLLCSLDVRYQGLTWQEQDGLKFYFSFFLFFLCYSKIKENNRLYRIPFGALICLTRYAQRRFN